MLYFTKMLLKFVIELFYFYDVCSTKKETSDSYGKKNSANVRLNLINCYLSILTFKSILFKK
jgi:hypothetical protein